MKHKLLTTAFIVMMFANSLVGQSIGGMVQMGIYSPKYTNVENAKEEISGTGFITLGAVYELNLGNQGKQIIPIVISYSRFGTEQNFGENQVMTNSANSLTIGAGYKYFFVGDESALRPFVGLVLNYEGLINSKYYYDAQQTGDLDWRSNFYTNFQAGVGVETGLNSRIDFYVTASTGLLNRLDESTFGIYKDNFYGLGVNFVFN
jgi:outer membrane protein W